jgi:hypothetical protein
MTWRVLAATLFALGLAAVAASQTPEGSEFPVNEFTPSSQVNPAISADGNGDFVVAWSGVSGDTLSFDVFARRFASTGTAVGSEFLVNSWTTGYQAFPSLAHLADGGFMVVWQSVGEDGSAEGVAGRRFNSAGQALGQDFVVNSHTTGIQRNASAACGTDGRCTVVWESIGQDGSAEGVFGRRYASNGTALDTDFQVNQYTNLSQNEPSVSKAPDGGFLVVWQSAGQGGFVSGVFARRYSSLGVAIGDEFHVGGATSLIQRFPDVAHDVDGGFLVAWQDGQADGGGSGIAGQSFDSAGHALGAQFTVNAFTTGPQVLPRVARQAAGRFVVAWPSNAQDGSNFGVFARRVKRLTRTLGPEFRLNTSTLGYQASPAISTGQNGQFVVAWVAPDGSDRGVFAQRYEAVRIVSSGGGLIWGLLALGLIAGSAAHAASRSRRRQGPGPVSQILR